MTDYCRPRPHISIAIAWLPSGPRIGDGPGIYAIGRTLLGPFASKASAISYLIKCHRSAADTYPQEKPNA